jgi:hypothetical protein
MAICSRLLGGLGDRISVQFRVMKTIGSSPGKTLARVPSGTFVRVEKLPGSRAAASSAASRAHKHGDLIAIRKGLYFKGVKTRYGLTRPSAEAIAVEVLGKVGVGPAGHSAARAFGLTTQVPATPMLTVAGPVPTSVPGVKVSKRNNMHRRDLSYTEIALLELLRGDWESTVEGGWAALVSAAAKAIRERKVRPIALADAVAAERSPAARASFARLTKDLRDRRRSRRRTDLTP